MSSSRPEVESLAEAVANGRVRTVKRRLESGENPNTHGADGCTPLFIASLWGNQTMIEILLECDDINVNQTNKHTKWTALHAATFQEHGNVSRVLLKHGANPRAEDCEKRTPKDYATISENVWPLFADLDMKPTSKSELVEKNIIRKIEEEPTKKRERGIRVPGAPY
eukprot:g2358.t1